VRVEIKNQHADAARAAGARALCWPANASRTNVWETDAMPALTHPLAHAGMYVTSRRAKIGSAYHVHKDLMALYSGRLTLANGAFLLLYTAWLQWTARIVAPRHFLRLHTASLWIAPVVGEDFCIAHQEVPNIS